jgi:raffinose/stachyose/melibiose transport system permease protein
MSRNRYGLGNLFTELAMICTALVIIFPVYVLVTLSLKSRGEVTKEPLSLPSTFIFSNYSKAWSEASLGPAIMSSMVITVSSGLLLVLLGSLASFTLARRATRLSYAAYLLFLLGLVLPFQLALIPLYQIVRDLHLIGTYWSMIGFYTGLQLPFTIFLYTGFLRSIPRDYEQAAAIDGASQLEAFAQVVFPLLRPVTGTVVILNAIFTWNDFLTPLLYLSGTDRRTIPVAVNSFVGQYVTQWQLVFAGLVIAIAPILLVYFLLQRTIIKGFASGLKG